MGRPQTSDLTFTESSTINQKLTDIKNILAPQSEIDRKKTDQEIANILKNNTNKLRNLNAVGAQNSGGMSAEANLTFDASRAINNTAPAKSEPQITLAGKASTKPILTPQEKEIEDRLMALKPGKSMPMPSGQPPRPGLPKLTRRVGSSPQSTGRPSTSPSLPKSKSVAEKMIEELRKLDPNSREADQLEEAAENLKALKKRQPERRRRNVVRQPGNGNGAGEHR